MSEETKDSVENTEQASADTAAAVAEESQEKRTVPLEALEAERRKRQDLEYQSKWYESQIKKLEETSQKPKEEVDEYTQSLKQEIRQKIFKDLQSRAEADFIANHPNLKDEIQNKLQPILQKKPWLANSIATAENRYARSKEIIDDFYPKVTGEVKKKLEENENTPKSPQGSSKGSISKSEMMAKMARNRSEFSKYRAELRGKPPNIR